MEFNHMSYRFRNGARDTARVSGLAVAFSATFIVLTIVIGSMAVFGFGLFQRSTADFRGETEAIERTQADGAFRIASYEWYFDQCAAIQAAEGRINAQLSELDGDPAPSEDRRERINTNLAAMRGQRDALIARYNQEARKEETTGAFRANDLPMQINVSNPTTTCTFADES